MKLKEEKFQVLFPSTGAGIDIWLVSGELKWTIKFYKGNTRIYINNLTKKKLKEISQLIYNQTGIKPRFSK